MIGTVMLSSLKQIKASETNCALTMKWFFKKFARCNNVAINNFQKCQTVYTTFTRLEIERNKEIERKSVDLKHFRDLSKTGPSLKDFLTPKIEVSSETISVPNIPYIQNIDGSDQKGK